MSVPILKERDVLIASIQSALSDDDLTGLRDALADSIGRLRASGVVIDVGALDVLDSFATRTIRNIAYTAKLRGLTLEGIPTALDLEEGMELLRRRSRRNTRHVY